ncbi:MAG: hypothetical protein JSS12_03575 [Verrucomicrobia bacterium]|nr:hypothetical protein [Verrucomicrobiota bacterium]
MLKRSLLVTLLLSGSLVASEAVFDVALSQGYKRERLDFSISGPHGKPNILSELIFKHIDVYVTRLSASCTKDDYFIKGGAAYGVICHGSATDDDYFSNNRKGKFSHSTLDIKGDYTADLVLRVGKMFHEIYGCTISPQIGYGGYYQKLRLKNGKGWMLHPFSSSGKDKFSIEGLNSTFKSWWYGPQLGCEVKKAFTKTISGYVSYFLVYPLKYDAKGHWNLREKGWQDFDLHNKTTKSFGNIAGAGVDWTLCKDWTLKLEYEFMKFYSRGGHQSVGKHHTKLHRAHLTSNEVRLTAAYAF